MKGVPPASGPGLGGFLSDPIKNSGYFSELHSHQHRMTFEDGRYALVENGASLVLLDLKERLIDYVLAWDTAVVRGVECASSFREWRGPYAYNYANLHGGVSLPMFVAIEVLAISIPLLFTNNSRFYTYRIHRARQLGMKVYLIDEGCAPRILTEDDVHAHITWRSNTPIPSDRRACVISAREVWNVTL